METETKKASAFRLLLRVAEIEVPGGRVGVWVEIKWEPQGGRLSFSGVEGPKRNGEAHGGSGQIDMGRPDHVARSPEYDRIAALWERWHLNDMRAGCEHQRAEGWGKGPQVEVVTYKLTGKTCVERQDMEKGALRALAAGETVAWSPEERALYALPYDRTDAPDADGPGAGRYEVARREMKHPANVYPHEHPAGVLTKPCPTCGYKYGSQWLREEVPAEVLEELRAMPDLSGEDPWGGA